MYRAYPYIALFVVLALLQVFLFDNLSISVYLSPLIYVAFVVLLPLDLRPSVVLLATLALGVAMDWTMGGAGVNTIATLPLAVLRRPLLRSICGEENIREGGIPSPERLGRGSFLRYLIAMVAVHHLLFFLVEALSWSRLPHTFARWLLSGAVSVGFIWLIARIFTAKQIHKS